MSSASGDPTRRGGRWATLCLFLCTLAAMPQAGTAQLSDPVRFEGNKSLGEARLRREAVDELADFRSRGRRRADADDAAYQMEVTYHGEGYHFAEVEYRLEEGAGGNVVTFEITEGPRVFIRSLRFEGNRRFGSRELRAFFENRRTGLLGAGPAVFVEPQADQAAGKIRDLYYGDGYIHVEVAGPALSFSADRSQVDLTLTVDEGVRYWVAEIHYSGDVLDLARAPLEMVATNLRGQAYYPRRELDVRSAVLEAYGNLGYPDVEAEVTDVPGAEPGAVVLEVALRSGPRVTIGDVIIGGQLKTQDRFVRRRVQLGRGDLYSQREFQQTFRELYGTGIFSKIDLQLEETGDPGLRDLSVTVEEGPSRELWVEPGWGSYELARLRVGARENNLRGTGRVIRAEGGISVKSRDALVGITDPWFLDSKVTADLPLSYLRRKEPSFTREELTWQANFSRKLSRRLTGTAGYRYSATNIQDVAVDTTEPEADDNYNLGSVQVQVTFDDRDDVFFPSKGQRYFLGGELASRLLGGSIGFYRFTGGARWFHSLGNHTVVGLRYATGITIPSHRDLSVPLGERFFNGGGNTVRSFHESQLGPKDTSGEPVGGLGYNVVNLELRQRLWGNWAGTLFVDYGNISPNRTRGELDLPPYETRQAVIDDTLEGFFSDFRAGIGCGLQYLLPVGPARLDLAFNPDAREERKERRFSWHFNVGMAF